MNIINIGATREVVAIRWFTSSTFSLVLKRDGFVFIPGQCVNIGIVGSGINREYSTYSSIGNKNRIEFLIKVVEDGAVSNALSKLKKGDKVQIDGSYGKFTIPDPTNKLIKYYFIGTGTGIAPFHSYITSYPFLNYKVIHGIRTVAESYDAKDYGRNYISCTSRDKTGTFAGRVTDYLKSQPIDVKAYYYLCGNSEMINEVYDILSNAGVNGNQIVTESFF